MHARFLLLVIVPFGEMHAQDMGSGHGFERPAHHLGLAVGVLWSPPAHLGPRYGNAAIESGLAPAGHARAHYALSTTSGDFIVGLGVLPIAMAFVLELPGMTDSAGQVMYEAGTRPVKPLRSTRIEADLLYGWNFKGFGRFTFSVAGGLRMGYVPRNEYSFEEYYETGLEEGPFFTMNVDPSERMYVGLASQAALVLSFPNFNMLQLTGEGYFAPGTIEESWYVIAPGDQHESAGTVEVPGSYFGFSLGYVFSWGAPKEPPGKRRARERELEGY